MSWKIKFHRKAIQEFDELQTSFKDKFYSLFDEIEVGGVSVLPIGKIGFVEDGIYELRVKGKDGIARSLYVTETEQTVRILLVFTKKTQKTPQRFIELAQKRRRSEE